MAQTVSPETLYFSQATYDDVRNLQIPSGFASLFGRPETGAVTERVNNALELSMDIVRTKGSIRPLTPRDFANGGINLGQNLKTNTGDVFQNVSYPFPLIEGRVAVNRDNILKYRQPGQLAITSNAGSDQDIITSGGRKFLSLVALEQKAMAITAELSAAQSLQTGKVLFSDGSTAYDFGRATTNTVTPATVWTNALGVPLNDLTNHRKTIDNNGECDAKAVVMGTDAWSGFIQNAQVVAAANIREISFITAGDKLRNLPSADFIANMESRGFAYMAYLKDFRGKEHFIFVYNKTYRNSSSVVTDFMTRNDVLMFDPMIRLDRFFGPRTDWGIISPEKRFVMAQFGISTMEAENMIQEVPNGVFESWMFHHNVNSDDKTLSDYITMSPIYACTAVDMAGTLQTVVA